MDKELIKILYKIYKNDYDSVSSDHNSNFMHYVPFRIKHIINENSEKEVTTEIITLKEFGLLIQGKEIKDVTSYSHSKKYFGKILNAGKKLLLKKKINQLL